MKLNWTVYQKRLDLFVSGRQSAVENGHMVCTIDNVNGCKYRQKSEKYDPGNFIRHIQTAHPVMAKSCGLMQEEAAAPSKQKKNCESSSNHRPTKIIRRHDQINMHG